MAAQPLTKSNLKGIPYGKEVSFARGIKGRSAKNDPSTVRLFLNGRVRGIRNPIKVMIGVYPDVTLDEVEERAAHYRKLMRDGIHPKAWEEERSEEHRIKQLELDAKKITLKDLLQEFELDRQRHNKGVAPNTTKDRKYTINHVFKSLMDRPISGIGREELEAISDRWRRRGKAETAKKGFRYLSSLFNYAVNTPEYLPKNPLASFKGRISTSSAKHRVGLDSGQCQALLDAIGYLTDPTWRDQYRESMGLPREAVSDSRSILYDFAALLLMSGIRKNELMTLEWKDVFLKEEDYRRWDAQGPYFQLITSKQQQPMGIPITRYMMGPINRLKAHRRNDYVFPSPRPGKLGETHMRNERKIYPILQSLVPEDTPRLTAQLFRKTFATMGYQCKFDMKTIDLITGHFGSFDQGNVATNAYIAANVEHHRDAFERIHVEMLADWDGEAHRALDDYDRNEDQSSRPVAEPEVIGPSDVRDIMPSNVVATTHDGMVLYGSTDDAQKCIEEQIASGILVPDENGMIIKHGAKLYKDEDGIWDFRSQSPRR